METIGGLLVMIYMTLYELLNLIINYKLNKKNKVQKIFNGISQKISVREINYSGLNYEIIKKHIDKSIPVIIKNAPHKLFKDFEKYTIGDYDNINAKNKIILNQYFMPDIPNVKNFLNKYVKKSIASLVQLNGNYKAGSAHIDFVSTYNIYFLQRGRKKVYIVPHTNTCYLDMEKGIDNIHVREEKNSDDSTNCSISNNTNDTNDTNDDKWLNKIPSYYQCELVPGDILLFNNSKCIHKFINLEKDSEVFSLRVFHSDSNPDICKNNILNFETGKHFYKIITNKNVLRYQNKLQ